MAKVPRGLKNWFFVHLVIDVLFAIPLLFFPGLILNLLGIPLGELIGFRLVGAALIGIGGASFFCKKIEEYKIMLTLKIFWSISAIIALILSLILGGPKILFFILGVFVIFSVTWIYYKKKLKN